MDRIYFKFLHFIKVHIESLCVYPSLSHFFTDPHYLYLSPTKFFHISLYMLYVLHISYYFTYGY